MKKANIHLLPPLIILLALGIAPLIFSSIMSFQGIWLKTPWLNKSFVFLDNFSQVLKEPQFLRALIHTSLFVWITLTIEMIIGFLLAYFLYHAMMGKNYIVQLGLFLPLATPAVLSAQMWRLFFHDANGVLNQMLGRLGLITDHIPWLSEPMLAWFAIGIAELWKVTPFVTVIFLASLLTIPKETWEAASIDGAKGWSLMRFIAIPIIRTSILVVALFRLLDGIRVFDLIYVLTQGGPGGSTDVLGLFVYRNLFSEMALGKGSAAALMMLLLACLFTICIFLIFKKYNRRYE